MKLDGLIAQSIEHCTGIAEIVGSNLVQAAGEFFSGFNFTTAQVVGITAMINHKFNHKFISFSAIQICDLSYIHLHFRGSVVSLARGFSS